ncbi:MAG: BamA/TamA family outer membrane protein [Bacteroidales bacterium]|nr:BamA/TamA family outer membrane protein [Bacteroidales bacterium]MDE6801713.1 outer membrane protein assembly factor [Muribaculaceae bacterium]
MLSLKRFLISTLLLVPLLLQGQEISSEIQLTELEQTDSIKPPKKNFIHRIIDYFGNANRENKDRGFDITFIGGPSYSSEKKFMIGILAAGTFSTNRADSLTPLSNVSLYTSFSTSGFYSLGVMGTARFRRDFIRLNYDLQFSSLPDKFWGIGYEMNSNNDNETRYKLVKPEIVVKALFGVLPHLYVGPMTDVCYLDGNPSSNADLSLWNGEKLKTFNFGVGANISYDTRDNLTGPHSGVNIELSQKFYPKWLRNTYSFASTELSASGYIPAWRSGIIALQYHSLLTYGDTPWSMLATMGGSYTMRGYYKGRYRDKGEMDATIEIRQRVWHRIGAVAWGGAGLIFPRISQINFHQLLPNYGVGLRWEFKKNVNVRFDLGFGKNQTGFIFNINEAF